MFESRKCRDACEQKKCNLKVNCYVRRHLNKIVLSSGKLQKLHEGRDFSRKGIFKFVLDKTRNISLRV